MKKPSILLLLMIVALPCWAQVKVILLRDTAQFTISLSELERRYPPSVGLGGVFKGREKALRDILDESGSLNNYLLTNYERLPVKSFYVVANEFVGSTGNYEIVLCEFIKPNLTIQQERVLLPLVEKFYATHSVSLRTSRGFRQPQFMQIDGGFCRIEDRKPKIGPGVIATIEAAIATTQPDTVKKLAFNFLNLATIPEVVYRFRNLEEIDLSTNLLTNLPARLTSDLPRLERLSVLYNAISNDSVFITPNKHLLALNLQGNKLTRIPSSIRNNRRLESLWLGNNDLTGLDTKTLRRLRQLTDLNLYNAGLTTLPKTIGRLKRVKVLDLYYNKFKELPRQVGRMKRLEQLAVAHNDLSQLPASLAKLRRLQTLYAHHNRISQLPDAFSKLKNLRVLDIGYNWFTVAPAVLASLPALEELDLNNNNLQELPTTLGTLKGLKKLYLRSNPLTRDDAKAGPYAPIIRQLEANQTEVFY